MFPQNKNTMSSNPLLVEEEQKLFHVVQQKKRELEHAQREHARAKYQLVHLERNVRDAEAEQYPATEVFNLVRQFQFRDEPETRERWFTKNGHIFFSDRGDQRTYTRAQMKKMFPDARDKIHVMGEKRGFWAVIDKLASWKPGEPFEPVFVIVGMGN